LKVGYLIWLISWNRTSGWVWSERGDWWSRCRKVCRQWMKLLKVRRSMVRLRWV